MFTPIYRFVVKAQKKQEFREAWHELTKLIIEHEGALGSRLHKLSENEFIAYAQWPTKEKWEQSGQKLPPKAHQQRARMHEACEVIQTIYEMEVVEDLLIHA
jgi:heme-degrading monooxygenase HmoA